MLVRSASTSSTGNLFSAERAFGRIGDPYEQHSIQEAMEKYGDKLTPFEKSEMSEFAAKGIFCIGARRVQGLTALSDKDGFYRVEVGE